MNHVEDSSGKPQVWRKKMLRIWIWTQAVAMLLCGSIPAAENLEHSLPASGNLDSGGGTAQTSNFQLLGGSLGGSLQTGRAQSTGLILESGSVFGSVQKLPDGILGDFDGNGKVEFTDFLIFARGFGKSSGDEGFDSKMDFNKNQRIDFADFVAFARAYGG